MGLSSVGPEKAWQIAVDHLKMDLPMATFDKWGQHCEFVSFENGRFTIGVYNPYKREASHSSTAETSLGWSARTNNRNAF
jgi:hypothetical protein